MWNEINNEIDLKSFIDMYCDFHDSCIKELRYISGAYVSNDLSMYPINDQRILKLIIQRQLKNPSVIEMEFVGLKSFSMCPSDEKHTCEILDATMILKNNCVYWCDCGGVSEDELDSYEGTFICAEKVRWRVADEYIGPKEVYINYS